MKSDVKCIWEYCDKKCECNECTNCPHYKKETENKMKESINTNKLINIFKDMANRGILLARGDVTQEDLLIQIIGTIAKVAIED